MTTPAGYHETRFTYDQRRDVLWKTLCNAFFQRLIRPEDSVVELGAGYGHFINHIRCRQRIAVDQWDGMISHLAPGVTGYVGSVTDLNMLGDDTVDFVFASNLFEHLTQADFARTLEQLGRKLKAGGTLNILQPNYRYAYREYFDDYTHVAVYSHNSLIDFLEAHGFRVTDARPKFLPLSLKSRLPTSPALIRLYLWLPFKPLAKQMLIRAQKISGDR